MVRVRTFELRLIALGLAASWMLAAGFVLLGYHPGGPLDLFVGLATGVPIVIALAGLVWPPVARGDRAFAGLVWLGLAALLLLGPSIGGLLNQLLARGPQTLIPSPEAAYPWLLALLGTSLFTGLGVARRILGETALRRRRLVRGAVIGLAATVLTSGLVTAVALGNELALRDRPVASSRFGPTDPALQPPTCDRSVGVGKTAVVDISISGDVDGRALGTVDVHGVRSFQDFRWLAYVASSARLGQFGEAVVGADGWRLDPATGWQQVRGDELGADALDVAVRQAALSSGARAAAEFHGISYFEGARATHCRIAIDGPTLRRAFPAIDLLIGSANVGRWRGELDYWVFADGELGRASAAVSGDAFDIAKGGLQAHVFATMTATERDAVHPVTSPVS
jgi:hypothetical protein